MPIKKKIFNVGRCNGDFNGFKGNILLIDFEITNQIFKSTTISILSSQSKIKNVRL